MGQPFNPSASAGFVAAMDTSGDEPGWPGQAGGQAGWMGWRLRALVVLALLGCFGLFLLLRLLALGPHLDASFRRAGTVGLELVASGHPELLSKARSQLVYLEAEGQPRLEARSALLHQSPRWAVSDGDRTLILADQQGLAQLVQHAQVTLGFADGTTVQVRPVPRGFGGVGATFWLISALALALYLIAAVVYLSRPGPKNLLYALMTLAQSGNLLLIAVESTPGWGLPSGFIALDFRLRTLFDLVTAGAIVHVGLIHPRRVGGARRLIAGFWLALLVYATLTSTAGVQNQWWWTQALLIVYGLTLWAVQAWNIRNEPHPVALVLQRLAMAASATLMLLTLAIALTERLGPDQYQAASIGSVIWYVFFASLLLLVPFLSRSQHVMREFAMLAGLSTVATSLDLLFITVFAFGQFTSLTLALFVSIGLYAGVRQWLLNHLAGTRMMTAERSFESLYKAARAIETTPAQAVDHVARMVNELFEPLEIRRDPRQVPEAVIDANGTQMAVPLQQLPVPHADVSGTLVLRHARRGRRLFTQEDARLANRMLGQLRTAVVYDRAVEQGRSEERMRLAQDLHDDIGARLLTLMYKAQNPEMEEYVRHTLQDLKTLTRGLAAAEHPLSHAAAEWKADISQRLAASHCSLAWHFETTGDVPLSVVQWSGLTRILRELVNNVIAHAGASQVEIDARFDQGVLQLKVADDGHGRDPKTWAHGLGLGGVRKRVKLLGGQVQWKERSPKGIVCEVRVDGLGEPQT
ncbi:MAG: histidine kinase [Ideonella sp.]|nr:histidine kinase [Ideonella sp.]